MEIIPIEQRIETIEKKLDTVLSILGHGREKSHAQLEREAEGTMERLRLKAHLRDVRYATRRGGTNGKAI